MPRMQVTSANMFRPKADANHARGEATKNRKSADQSEKEGKLERTGSAENATDDPVLHGDLQFLGGARGKFAAPLDRFQIRRADISSPQLRSENIGGSHRVLDRQIDSDASNR